MNEEQLLLPPLPTVVPIAAMEGVVGQDVIDLNGHMGAANYYLVFQRALYPLFRPLGFGVPYRERGLTVFQREAHIRYERELNLGDPISIRSWLVGYDHKRFHHYHEMRKGPDGPLVATIEYVTTNVDLATRRSAPFPADVEARLAVLSEAFASVEIPPGAVRLMNLTASPRTASE
ncbi:Acyl-CoA thioester hydrolase [Pseudomonas sp. 9AZ]|uniref:thioesterase family protein n=1 Tax=Pseudomonas sp. 9AZ TaxID=2653168 RepID=UPI0012F436DC|nr:thioesterase family protein [Pseudomonas sp. 9AZ]VXD04132.1 Acyl-CoA thioester hydrolase [Pseudomonas sp. 9AZ]